MSRNTDSILQSHKQLVVRNSLLYNYAQEILWLATRLFMQISRRPAGFISGLIQPLLWLLLFGGLFQNIPLDLFKANNSYGAFLSCGIIVFTSFTGSLNAGLPLMFDREFGFLNRLLASPIISHYSIMLGATIFMICITMTQNLIIALCSFRFFNSYLSFSTVSYILVVLIMVTSSISSLSLSIAFILPGHVEFLALILVVNLPVLFASTALAPIYFMPYWLQIVARFNPLTYATEAIRLIILNQGDSYKPYVAQVFNGTLSASDIVKLLAVYTLISFFGATAIVSRKME